MKDELINLLGHYEATDQFGVRQVADFSLSVTGVINFSYGIKGMPPKEEKHIWEEDLIASVNNMIERGFVKIDPETIQAEKTADTFDLAAWCDG